MIESVASLQVSYYHIDQGDGVYHLDSGLMLLSPGEEYLVVDLLVSKT